MDELSQSYFHADAQTAHIPVSIDEAVAAIDASRRRFDSIQLRRAYNTSLYPVSIEQDSERIVARDIAAILWVIESIASAVTGWQLTQAELRSNLEMAEDMRLPW